jgi:hypothetical protein
VIKFISSYQLKLLGQSVCVFFLFIWVENKEGKEFERRKKTVGPCLFAVMQLKL